MRLRTEPAVIVGLLEALLSAGVAFGLPVTHTQVALIMAVAAAAGGVIVAVTTHHTTLAVVIGLANALGALLVGFGLHITPEQTGGLIAVISMVWALINRDRTSPVAGPGAAVPRA
jgi:hypothetical protein